MLNYDAEFSCIVCYIIKECEKNDKSLTIHKLNNNLYKYMMDEKLKILLCEDDENLGMLLREFLQAKGFNADLCPDGEKVIRLFLKGNMIFVSSMS